MASVTIRDEATRRVVLACLWDAIGDRIGPYFDELGWSASTEALRDDGHDDAGEMEEVLIVCAELVAVVKRVRLATVGESVGVCLSEKKWSDGIERAMYQVTRDEFPSEAADLRARLLTVRDAALRLQSELKLAEVA